jgi:GT2 family glycosyltransferase
MKDKQLDVSIIIVSWNTKSILQNCINSVIAQSRDFSYEIIVVDNGSVDGSVEMIKGNFPEVKLIENRKNVGFAAANNQGVRIAKGEFILFLNSDTVILDNAIGRTLQFLKDKADAAAVGCKLLNADGSLQPSCYNFYSFFRRFFIRRFIPRIFLSEFAKRSIEGKITRWDYNSVREIDYVRGAFLMVRGDVIRSLGLFDEQFFMYSEEADLCLRMKQEGLKVLFYPEAEIIHMAGASAKRKPLEIMRRTVSLLLLQKKYHCNAAYSLLRIYFLLNFVFRFFIMSVSSAKEETRNSVLLAIRGICTMSYNVEGQEVNL